MTQRCDDKDSCVLEHLFLERVDQPKNGQKKLSPTRYSKVQGHRNWQIETAAWNFKMAGFLHFF